MKVTLTRSTPPPPPPPPPPTVKVMLELTEDEAIMLRILAGSIGTAQAQVLLHKPDGGLSTTGRLVDKLTGNPSPEYDAPFRSFIGDLYNRLGRAGVQSEKR